MALAAARVLNAAFSPSYTPVAIFLGGTSTIGQTMAQAFARYSKGNARIVIVGRDKQTADKIIDSFPSPEPTSVEGDGGLFQTQHEFMECDLTLMRNVRAATAHILARYRKINFLVMSCGIVTFKGRNETSEGMDKKLALNYYARWKFINDLMPALRRAKDDGEDAKVMSVLAAGKGGPINIKDFGMKKSYSLAGASLTAPTYNDLMMEEFASRQPDMSFMHIFPGFIRTPIFGTMHWILKPFSPLFFFLMYPFSVSPKTCGEYMLSALFSAQPGASRWGSKGEDIGDTRYFGCDEARRKLWEHTVVETAVNS